MVIAIDARAFGWAGIGRYIRSLVTALLELQSGDRYILLIAQEDLAQAGDYFASWISDGVLTLKTVGGSYYSWREQLLLGSELSGVEADLWQTSQPCRWRACRAVALAKAGREQSIVAINCNDQRTLATTPPDR